MRVEQAARRGDLDGQRRVLRVVVGEDGDARLRRSSRRATRARAAGSSLPLRHHAVERDLDVDLVVGAVDAGGVVDRVGVQDAAGQGALDAAALGQAEVAALADDPDAQVLAVDPHGVVGLVADLERGSRSWP